VNIIADKDIPFLHGVLEPYAEVSYLPGHEISGHHLKHADALLIRTRTVCDRKLLEHSGIRFIGTATIGHDHIDADYCESRGIVWKNAPGCNAGSVDQYMASSLVRLARKHGFSLRDKALGVVGVGHVGSRIVKTAELLGMHVYLCDPPRVEKEGLCGFISLEGILRECDIITFHVPLQWAGKHSTHHMINRDLLEHTVSDAIIINTSRGPVADTNALKSALSSCRILGTVADVWENEPAIDRELLGMADIATPHIAGYSADGKANGTAAIIHDISSFFQLGLDGWEVSELPPPVRPTVEIDCRGLGEEEVLSRAILAAYDVVEDDAGLRNDPSAFEALRASYAARREFHAFTLKLTGSWNELERKCRRMGFKVLK
jgi:erythronate-4-phosphate dehydrogenase